MLMTSAMRRSIAATSNFTGITTNELQIGSYRGLVR
jgi:hypothetical protein